MRCRTRGCDSEAIDGFFYCFDHTTKDAMAIALREAKADCAAFDDDCAVSNRRIAEFAAQRDGLLEQREGLDATVERLRKRAKHFVAAATEHARQRQNEEARASELAVALEKAEALAAEHAAAERAMRGQRDAAARRAGAADGAIREALGLLEMGLDMDAGRVLRRALVATPGEHWIQCPACGEGFDSGRARRDDDA